MTLAAAPVFEACLTTGENVTQDDVADAAGEGVLSVRECDKALRRLAVLKA